MPLMEQGNLDAVMIQATRISEKLARDQDIIALVPSCALMLKSQWPLLLPENKNVARVAQKTQDIAQYLVEIVKEFGPPEGIKPLSDSDVTLHLACHSRAQNMGQKAGELLKLIPSTTVHIIDRCAGHGGTWGMMVDHFEVAMKIGKPVFDKAMQVGGPVTSECPLAKDHIAQGVENLRVCHPLELLLESYGL
jgi:glycerol-3-phosphate dehydrogenase subunit C